MKNNRQNRFVRPLIKITAILIITGLSLYYFSKINRSNINGGHNLQNTANFTIPTEVEIKWNFQTGSEIKSSPVVLENHIVVGSTDGFVYCLDLQGNLLWKFQAVNAIEATALVYGNTVFVGCLGGILYALELNTGKKLWTYKTGNQITAAPNIWSDGRKTYLLIGSYDFFLHCVDAATGLGVWKYETNNFLHAQIAVENNFAVFGGCDGNLHVVDIPTGKKIAKTALATYIAGAAILENGLAFIGDYDGKVSCVDFLNQTVLWSFESHDRQLPFIGQPVIQGNRLLIGSRDRFVYSLSRSTGELLWYTNTGSSVDASVLADNRHVLVANMRGDILLLNLENGQIIWTFELGSPIVSSPAIFNNYIITGTLDGNIYCLGAP